MPGCECNVCRSPDPRNHRYRCSVLIESKQGNILIDTTPELRLQLVRAQVGLIHAVLYTHYHVDHLFGLDDLRQFPRKLGGPVPIFCTEEVEAVVRQVFAYAFHNHVERLPPGSVPMLAFQRISSTPFDVLGHEIVPIPLKHSRFDVFGFRLGDVAYCTDVNFIPESSWPLLKDLDVLVLDALRFKPHPAHFSIQEALEVIERVKPKQAYLTHMTHDIEHEIVNRQLPPGVALAYDGLQFQF
jgi:phosphoribosyl 1,2-cyclic phosphate phosphodiesterase